MALHFFRNCLLAFACAIFLFSLSTPAFAVTVSPTVKYQMHGMTFYSLGAAVAEFWPDWQAAYDPRNEHPFSEASWYDDGTQGVATCPCFRGWTQPIPREYICESGYTPDRMPNPTACTRPNDKPDLSKIVGKPQGCQTEGNPCDAGSGNKYQAELDYMGSANTFPFKALRSYNSNSTPQAHWGNRWRGEYDRSINFISGTIVSTANLNRSDGKILNFNLVSGQWVPEADVIGTLSGNASTGWTYTNADNEIETYDRTGTLTSIANRTGQMHTLTYSCKTVDVNCPVITSPDIAPQANLLLSVTDSGGRQLKFRYDGVSRIVNMTDPAGKIYTYTYSGPYPANNLISITYPDSKTRTYVYGEAAYTSGATLPHALTGIVDENGNRYATWSYDAQGRAISSEHGVGVEKVVLTYNTDGTTSVLDALGGGRSYQFQTILGVTKSANMTRSPGGATRTMIYDSNGNVASRTDFNGNVTTYTYDLARNLETSRTEGFGTAQARTITTQWHATYRLPTAIAEPLRRTSFSYDASGNLLTKSVQTTADATGTQGFGAAVVGAARTWTHTYNAVGQVLTMTGPRTDVVDLTTYAYDAQGNLATVTNALNQITTLSNYDANGRVGKIADANGTTTDLAYHARGWLLSKVVTGAGASETTSYQYDGVGQMTQVSLPDGSSIAYTYDPAHRLTAIADSLGNSVNYTLDAMGNRTSEQVKDPAGTLARQTSRVYDALNRLQTVTGAAQ